jgi:plasmid stability protein
VAAGVLMASLVVRKLDDEVVRRLKERAKANGRSAEAEHRVILEAALQPKRSGRELWESLSRGGPVDVSFETVTDQSTGRVTFE